LPGHARRHGVTFDNAHGDGRVWLLVRLEERADPAFEVWVTDLDVPKLPLKVEGSVQLPQLEHHVDALDRHQALRLGVR
jgi:hypothetical protein